MASSTNMSVEQPANQEARPAIFKSTAQECLCVAILTLAPAAATLSSSSFQTSLQATSEHFHVTGGRLTWSVSSVTLANGACLLLMGGVADALGRKAALAVGFFAYALFSLVAGFMDNYVALCVLRALMGMAVACATPAGAGFLGSNYRDSKRKNMVLSMFGIGSPVGGASGFFLAGVCLAAFSWRAIQYFLAILYFATAVLVVAFFPKDDTEVSLRRASQIIRRLDFGGAFLSLAAFTLICFALTEVDVAPHRWKTPYIPATLAVGLALLPALGVYEAYVPAQPLLPLALFKDRDFVLCTVITTLSWITFQGILNYFAILYFEVLRGYAAIIVACCMLPQPITGVLVNVVAGLTMHRIPGRYMVTVGSAGFLVSSVIWATMSMHRNYFLGPFWAFCVGILGADLTYNVSNRCALNLVPRNVQSRAAGTYNTIVMLATSVAFGIASAIVSSNYRYYGTPQQNLHKALFWHGIKYAYYCGIAFQGACVVLSFFLRVGVIGAREEGDEEK